MHPSTEIREARDTSSAGRNGRAKRLAVVIQRSLMTDVQASEVPRLLLTRQESARSLGMSLRHFQRHVQPHIPCVYSGQLRQYRPEDLRGWAERSASRGMGED